MKNLKVYILSALVGSWMVACSEDDKLTVEIQETVERGAVLRTVSITGGSWNVTDDTETFTIEWEEQDIEDGDLLDEVRIFADLVDNTDDATTDPAEVQLATIPASEFSGGENGLPRTTYSISLAEMGAALGIGFGDYNCGDEFNLRIEMDLTDGRTITQNDVTGTVSGGSFFASPFNYRIPLIFLLPSEDVYTGQYNIDFSTGFFGVDDYLDGVYTIEAIDNVTRVIRDVPTLEPFGPFGPEDIVFTFVCDEIIFGSENDLGAGCDGANSVTGAPADVNTTFDVANPDDSAFGINYRSAGNEAAGCGSPSNATITLTKI